MICLFEGSLRWATSPVYSQRGGHDEDKLKDLMVFGRVSRDFLSVDYKQLVPSGERYERNVVSAPNSAVEAGVKYRIRWK